METVKDNRRPPLGLAPELETEMQDVLSRFTQELLIDPVEQRELGDDEFHSLLAMRALVPAALRELQKRVIANRNRRGWTSAGDISKTTCGLVEEVGEFERARRKNSREDLLDALADIMVWCFGGFEILMANAWEEVVKVVRANESRTGQTDH